MRLEKAYEYFSAYYEGSLDAAMRTQLDRMFEAHSVLRKDFESFAQTMEDLDGSFATDVPIPHDLHDRISARIDRAAYENTVANPRGIQAVWRKFAFGGLAVVLIGGATVSLLNRNATGDTAASVIPSEITQTTNAELRVEANAKGAFLRFQPSATDAIQIIRLPDGSLIQSYKVAPNQALDIPLKNAGEEPVALRVKAEMSRKTLLVIVPGSKQTNSTSGDGSLLDLAMAFSSSLGRPVVIETPSLSTAVRWELNRDNITRSSATPGELSVELKGELVRIRY
ncbi:MAG: hypothetical protein JNK63_03370 [Chthonomonas sp.]|nr:hypothetical protein [Chthonomonas sp.]